ncbi:MAG: DNA repair protein RadC [Deltaproteobacteria bacterium]|nr:DNA repair protein RadC [Deltaproteobacteria bacterium]
MRSVKALVAASTEKIDIAGAVKADFWYKENGASQLDPLGRRRSSLSLANYAAFVKKEDSMESPRVSGGIKKWPPSERPREVLLDKGAAFVSDAGLLAILLRTGTAGTDAVALGRRLLERFGGLRGIMNARDKDLKSVKGLGRAKVAQIMAASELAKRQLREGVMDLRVIGGPADVVEYLSLSMAGLTEEIFRVIYLTTGNAILAMEDLFKGTVNQSAVYPREVIKRALDLKASAVIFVHNHPSGDLEPSEQDRIITERLTGACRAVDITPLDHLIISARGYTSFKERGIL